VTDHPQPEAPPHPEDWVPVEHRVFGIDRRTILPALGVLVFMVLMAVGLPAIDQSVDYDDPIAAGDVMDLVAGKLTFVPAQRWNRVDGSLVGEGAPEAVGSVSVVAIEDVSVTVTTGKFDGTPDELERCPDPRVGQFVRGEAGERLREMATVRNNRFNEVDGAPPGN